MGNYYQSIRKRALLIGNKDYERTELNLRAPINDVEKLGESLLDPNVGGFFEVEILTNETKQTLEIAISSFLKKVGFEDFLLIYYSGHGILDDKGSLYLATYETDRELLRPKSISISFLLEELDSCHSIQQVLALDCCYSGSFRIGTKGDETPITRQMFRTNETGRGRIILTASTSTQRAWDADDGQELSLYTRYLIDGLTTKGAADRNGNISVENWHKYAASRVRSQNVSQTPKYWVDGLSGDLYIVGGTIPSNESPDSNATSPESHFSIIKRGEPEQISINDGLPTLEWCEVKSGATSVYGERIAVNGFMIAKYPVTNLEFSRFIESGDGYFDARWWDFSRHAMTWHEQNPVPAEPIFKPIDCPRVNISWFEAIAYTKWLSYHTGLNITLPTEGQWQVAAHGPENRLYPWGNYFDPKRCNTLESNINATTPVKKYFLGRSFYGVYDMSGNIWEMCLNVAGYLGKTYLTGTESRAVKGGAWLYKKEYALISSNDDTPPDLRCYYSGFRVVYHDHKRRQDT